MRTVNERKISKENSIQLNFPYPALQELGDVEDHRENDDRNDVSEEPLGVDAGILSHPVVFHRLVDSIVSEIIERLSGKCRLMMFTDFSSSNHNCTKYLNILPGNRML